MRTTALSYEEYLYGRPRGMHLSAELLLFITIVVLLKIRQHLCQAPLDKCSWRSRMSAELSVHFLLVVVRRSRNGANELSTCIR